MKPDSTTAFRPEFTCAPTRARSRHTHAEKPRERRPRRRSGTLGMAGTFGLLFTLIALLPGASPAFAQTGSVRATVETDLGTPLASVAVSIVGTTLGAFTGPDGVAVIPGVAAGEAQVRAARLGYGAQVVSTVITAGDVTSLSFTLESTPVSLGGIQVSVLRPDLRPEVRIEETQIREANPHDIGGVFRTLPGLDAIRRGGLGLDPVVRGLRDTQVGAYVDGMRTLPGGPGGMDTPLSHVDPSAIQGLEVVKGPYALTWGAGNMSAIRVETNPLPARGTGLATGRFLLGHDSNLSATETGLEVAGAGDRVGYTVSGAWRESGDYVSGDGSDIPAEFSSGEVRGRVGLFAGPASTLTLSGWYQGQRDIAYPGRPLNADWFDTYNGSLRWQYEPAGGILRSFDATGYLYTVDHSMNNDAKPTALPNPDRMPPFPMDITTTSSVEVWGGRASMEMAPGGDLVLEVGGDAYTAHHDAAMTNRNRDTGMVMMERLIWGGARITNTGVFTRVSHPIGRVSTTGTVRLDRMSADADSASTFFLENTSSSLSSSETNLSGAITFTLPVTASWSISAGAGSVVRSADANERFSDRSPSKRSQISAEFVGDPGLKAERSTQLDLWVEADYTRWAGSLNLFAQRIDDNITIEETDLPRQSPMSAPTVYRYINGDARYRGAEATARVAMTSELTLSAATSYVWGEDVTLNEPVLGASPLRADLGVRWEPLTDGRFVEVTGKSAARQGRVSDTRGEVETEGHLTLDIQGGMPLPGGVFLRAGINNLLDRQYVNHLNSRNPFTGIQVAEPGRVLFARLSVNF
jgi:iron complex outermembrane recepter protein